MKENKTQMESNTENKDILKEVLSKLEGLNIVKGCC